MKAVILAGGFGTRLQSVVGDLPKPMAPVGGKPFLEYLVRQLHHWGVPDIVLATGHKSSVIESYFGDGSKWGARITYSKENVPLGTGGALREALHHIPDEDFVILNGDSFINLDFGGFMSFHMGHQGIGTLCLVTVKDVSRYGCVQIDECNRIVAFSEKGTHGGGLINAGVYFFKRRVFQYLPSGNVSLEKEIMPRMISDGLYGYQTKAFFIDIGLPEDYAAACRYPGRLIST